MNQNISQETAGRKRQKCRAENRERFAAILLSLYDEDVASAYRSEREKLQLVSLPGLRFNFLADTEQTGPHHTYSHTLLHTVIKNSPFPVKYLTLVSVAKIQNRHHHGETI